MRFRFLYVSAISILFLQAGCRWFVKSDEKVFVEQALGSYSYEDLSSSYSGRFLLYADDSRFSVDIYGPFHILAASVRYNPDSTLVYLPLESVLLIMGSDPLLSFEGWELPLVPLVVAYRGEIVKKTDSVTVLADTSFLWKGTTTYLIYPDENKVVEIRNSDWRLKGEGEMEKNPFRPQRIIFSRTDTKLTLNLSEAEILERDPEGVFNLSLPQGIERIDYR